MFKKVDVPLLGIVENMSYFIAPDTGKRYDIFGEGGGQREADRLKVPLLGQVPIDIPTREAGDRGKPISLAEPESAAAKSFDGIAAKVRESGKQVTPGDVERARAAGATDVEIHDAVLIAAAFCMFNRYVDGLATDTPIDPALYDVMGRRMAKEGYVRADK